MKRTVRCTCCDRIGPHGRYDWCSACFQRWDRAGRPDTGPPPRPQNPMAPAWAGHRAAKAARMENYQDLRSWGETREQAAARLGICLETARGYDRALRGRAARDGEAMPEGTP